MRLLNTTTLKFEESSNPKHVSYAILSHTWGDDEVSYQLLNDGNPNEYQDKAGYQKVRQFCALAKQRGYEYGWVDSCCIDKKSSAELSEAINSMYEYYYWATECFIWLSDISGSSDEATQWRHMHIFPSRWFSRGWTLQELIASAKRLFLADDWSPIKGQTSDDFPHVLQAATGIDHHVLRDRNQISRYCVAERMSWASNRSTTRSEDRAYSLMGLFNINMPILYGEGACKAFRRLQHEIMQTAFDHTISAWRGNYVHSGFLAKSPKDFSRTPLLGLWEPKYLTSYSMTNVGLLVKVLVVERHKSETYPEAFPGQTEGGETIAAAIQCDIKSNQQWQMLVIYISSIPGVTTRIGGQSYQAYRRVKCADWSSASGAHDPPFEELQVLMLEDEHFDSATLAARDGWNRWNNLPMR